MRSIYSRLPRTKINLQCKNKTKMQKRICWKVHRVVLFSQWNDNTITDSMEYQKAPSKIHSQKKQLDSLSNMAQAIWLQSAQRFQQQNKGQQTESRTDKSSIRTWEETSLLWVMEYWNRLPTETAYSPSLERFKTHLNAFLCNLL